jgi:hypothetical protein
MTQSEFDGIVLTIANKEVDRMVIVTALRRQGDPKAREMEESQMMLSNIISSLRDYDITSTLLSQDDIDYMIELATIVTQTKP